MTTTIPAGWKLVPENLTLDMEIAFAEAWFSKVRCIDDPEMQDAYAAMLNAAPTAPDAPLTSMARAIFGDQTGGQMDAMAAVPSLSSLHGFAPSACDGMKSEDYVNKVRNGGCSLPDYAAPGVSTVEDAQAAVPADVMAALDRMCTPLDTSVLKGATAEADAFCMQLIRDYILRRPAPAAGDAQVMDFVREVAQQKPEKPDHWSSCGQCQSNSRRAEELLDEFAAQRKGDA